MRLMISIYKLQVEGGRLFLHEHPSHARSWHMKEVRNLMKEQDVTLVESDKCMLGLKTWGTSKAKLKPAKKPTKFMTNSRAMGRELERACDQQHDHQHLVDGRAAAAARYPPGLCRAMCRGIVKAKMEKNTASEWWLISSDPSLTRARTVRLRRDLEEFHDRTEIVDAPEPIVQIDTRNQSETHL